MAWDKEKKRIYGIAYREKHKERIRAYKTSEEYKANRRATRDLEKNKEECRAYYAKNREKISAKHKADNAKPEIKELRKQYRQRDYVKEYSYKKGKEKIANVEIRYVRELINKKGMLNGFEIPTALLEAKQLEILIKRELKK
jgi:hypothetical protein